MWSRPPRCWPRRAASRSRRSRARPRRISSACSAKCRGRRAAVDRRMTLDDAEFTILGCGSSGGVPRPALGWGACDPNNPKNRRRRSSLLVERRGSDGGHHPRPDRHLARPARAAARRRRRLARRRALHPRACRPHPRHRRPARAVHAPAPQASTSTSTSRTSRADAMRFGYCFATPPGSEYPPIAAPSTG